MSVTAVIAEGSELISAPLERARAALGKARLVWIDADSRSPEVESLLRDLGVHPLTIEDVFETRTVPKVEDFGRYLFILAHAVRVPAEGPSGLQQTELDILVGEGWVFSYHEAALTAPAQIREEALRTRRALDPVRIAHDLLDRLVDDALPAIDAFDDELEKLEKVSLARIPRRSTVPRVLALRSALHRFRRAAIHQREVLVRLARGEFPLIPAEQLPFFRDVHDHAVRIADEIDDARELLSGILEAHLSVVSNRLNEIMKVLTMMASVFLPISFIASVYGMNFQAMPELRSPWGYPGVLAAMALTAGGLLWWFRRRGWME